MDFSVSPNSNTQNVSVLQEAKDATRLLIINSKRLLRKRPFGASKIGPEEELIFTHYLYNAYLSTSLISSPVNLFREAEVSARLHGRLPYWENIKSQIKSVTGNKRIQNNSQLCEAEKRPLSRDPL